MNYILTNVTLLEHIFVHLGELVVIVNMTIENIHSCNIFVPIQQKGVFNTFLDLYITLQWECKVILSYIYGSA